MITPPTHFKRGGLGEIVQMARFGGKRLRSADRLR